MNRKKGYIFIFAGLLCVMAALALFVFNQFQSKKAGETSRRIVSEIKTITEQSTIPPDELPTGDPDRVMPEVSVENEKYVGILTVPAFELELPVGAELTDASLQNTPCVYSGSIYGRNLVIGAHNYSEHFGRISSLKFGDEVIFTDTERHAFVCEVVDIETLSPEQTDVLTQKQNAEDWDITLFTCTYSGTERVTVRCKMK